MSNPANYQRSGTEPLGSNPKILRGTQNSSPSGSGKPCGGTENMRAYTTTLRAIANKTPTKSVKATPSPVDHFKDDCV